MLELRGSYKSIATSAKYPVVEPVVLRVSEDYKMPMPLRKRQALILNQNQTEIPEGFLLYLLVGDKAPGEAESLKEKNILLIPEKHSFLANGDVMRLNPTNNSFRVLYRRNSLQNYFLVTERCNHYCLMCSQPPKNVDDSWIVDEILQTINLMDRSTKEIGFSGGEPTLLGDRFIGILNACKNNLPETAVHILSNGRAFVDPTFTSKYAAIRHPNMMVGIPIYSDVSSIHNYVVQADGAFDETIRGILNLKRLNQLVEIRVVLHKQTYQRLPKLAEFIGRNLTFVDHVALMGLENTGFTKANMEDLWIDPYHYKKELYEAASILRAYGINTSIYNHQLCVLDKRLWHLARKSISDWKNEYLEQCSKCSEASNCGGFFSSTIAKHSEYIHPLN